MPPPMIISSTKSNRLLINLILSDTLAPPRIAVRGRAGFSRAYERARNWSHAYLARPKNYKKYCSISIVSIQIQCPFPCLGITTWVDGRVSKDLDTRHAYLMCACLLAKNFLRYGFHFSWSYVPRNLSKLPYSGHLSTYQIQEIASPKRGLYFDVPAYTRHAQQYIP